jgi:hypothetical protein
VKAAMSMMGLCSDVLRMPLLPLEEPNRTRLRLVLESVGLLESTDRANAGPRTTATGPASPRTATAAHA